MYFLKNEKSYYKSATFLNNNNFVIFKNSVLYESYKSQTDQFHEIKNSSMK